MRQFVTEKTKEKKNYGFRSTETYFTIEAGHIIVHIILYHSIIKVNNCIVNRIRNYVPFSSGQLYLEV